MLRQGLACAQPAKTYPYLTPTTVVITGHHNTMCRQKGMMFDLMPIPRVFFMNETIPTSRRTHNTSRRMFTGGPDVHNDHAKNSNTNRLKITSKETGLGCSAKQNVLQGVRNYHKHDPAHLFLYNGNTTTLRYISYHKHCAQKKPENDGQTGSPCLHQPVLAHGGKGVRHLACKTNPGVMTNGPSGSCD